MKLTYFPPRDPRPDPSLSDRDYAAAHCQQVQPGRTVDLDLQALEVACRAAAAVGRKGDAGYITACAYEPSQTRREGGPAEFALIDQDEGGAEPDWTALDEYEGFAWTTASHRPDKPSWRVVIPFVEPSAHGKLRCPFRGAFIRNRTQPAFLPTHRTSVDAIEWRRLRGSKRLDAVALGAVEHAFEARPDSLLGAAFEAAGMVLREQTGGLVVRCPWVHLHSDGDVGGTAVFHSDPDNRGFGKFHCSRTECAKANRTSWDALNAIRNIPAVAEELRHWPDPGLDGYRRVEVPPAPPVQVQPAEPAPMAPVEVPEGARATPETWGALMNQRHTVLTAVGGKCRVLSWTRNDLGWIAPVLSSTPDFKARYQAKKILVEGLKAPISIAEWWLNWPERAEAESLTFRPDVQAPRVDGKLNLWHGYGVEPRPGSWALTQRFLEEIVAAGDPEHLKYILGWLAWVVQNPGERPEVVLVLRGRRGTGKNTILDALCKLFGQHAKTVSNPRHLVGHFNAHLADCALLFANEAIAASDKTAEAVLKTLVTDGTLPIERKGIDVEMWMNRLSVCMASNEDWCVPAGLDERRFAVFDVSPAKIQDVSYFAAIHAELRAGGYQAMLHDLLALPLGDWHPRQHVPKTEALVENQLDGLRGCDRVVHQILDTAVVEGGWSHFETALPHVSGSVFIPTSVVAGGDMRRLVSAARALSRCIRTEGGSRALSSLATVKNGFESMRTRGFVLPPLPEARANWAEASRLKVSWNEIPEWTAVPPKRF
jgi:hypothetical protein